MYINIYVQSTQTTEKNKQVPQNLRMIPKKFLR